MKLTISEIVALVLGSMLGLRMILESDQTQKPSLCCF